MELHVDIQINPHPETVDPKKLDELLDGELVGFEQWFLERQRAKGAMATGLISAERSMVKTYILYAATKRRER